MAKIIGKHFMNYLYTLLVILCYTQCTLHGGLSLSKPHDCEAPIQPKELYPFIQRALVVQLNRYNYSGIQTHTDLKTKIEHHANTEIPKLATLQMLRRTDNFNNDKNAQNELKNRFRITVSNYTKEKCKQLGIHYENNR